MSNNLTLGVNAAASGTYNLSGTGSLSVEAEYIGNYGSGTFTQSGGTNTVSYPAENYGVYLGYYSGASGSYSLSGGSLANYANEFVGLGGSGTFTQTAGSNTMTGTLYLAYDSGASGSYTLNGGSLSGLYEYIGYSGSGAFTHSGGTNTVSQDLTLGYFSGASGSYSLSDGGSLSVGNAETIGYSGTGTFTQTGGTNTAAGTGLYLGVSGGSGTYNLSGGSLSVSAKEVVGESGTGSFTQTGGSQAVTGDLWLGYASGASGSYTHSGGSNAVTGDLILGYYGSGTYNLSDSGGGSYLSVGGSEYIGYGYGFAAGSGNFTQTGGSHTVSGDLYLGYHGTGSYNLSDGGSGSYLSVAGSEYIGYVAGNGTFTQSGGTNTVTGNLVLGSSQGSGTYTLSGGSLAAAGEYVGWSSSGTFTQSGGTNTVSGDLYLAYNPGASSGSYSLSDSGNGSYLSVGGSETIGYGGSGSFTQSGGTHTVSGAGLYVGGPGGPSLIYLGNGSYNLSGGSLQATNEYVGNYGNGSFTQSGGSNTVTNGLIVGTNAGSGSYSLSNAGSGSYLSVGGSEYIGFGASGSFTQSGGTHTVGGTLSLGGPGGGYYGNGSYNLSGGSLSVGGTEIVGNYASGSFTQTGGTNTAAGSGLYVGYYANGSYSLSGGSLSASYEILGYSRSGAFTQSGGTNAVSGNLYLGSNSGASGSYNQSGGSLSAGVEYIGYLGNGAFTQTGGSNTVTGDLQLGTAAGASGTYNLSGSGSTLSASDEYIGNSGSGAFTQSGGTNAVAGGLYLGYYPGASGTYSLSGGSLAVSGSEYVGIAGGGSFTQSGGSHTVSGDLYVGGYGGNGSYSLSGGSLAAGTVNLKTGGTFSQTGGSLSATTFNQQGGSVTAASSLQNQGTFNYYSGAFAGRLLNYGSVNFDADFTAGNGLANYSAIPLSINAGRTVTLNGAGLDNQGTLAGNGTLVDGGPLLNDTTGTLSGTGAIQGNLTNQGTVSPGTPLGTLTITGNYTQTASGTLVEQIASASSYSTLAVTGSASLNGALKVVLLNGYLPGYGQSFTGILTAPGGVSGTFNTIINQYITPTLYWKVLYGANSVGLQTTGAMVSRNYTIPGLTGNEWRVGSALNGVANNATGDLNTVLNAIDSLNSNSAVANALQQISADKVSSLTILGFAGSDFFNRGLANRITNLRYGGPGATSGSRLDGLMLAYNSSSLAGLITGKKEAGPETPWGVYLYPDMSLGSQKSSPNQTGFNFGMGGFTGGADYQVRDNLLVGLATGYGYTGANLHGSGGGVQNNTWPLNAYVAYLPQSFYAYGSLGYALNLFNLQRDIDFGGLSRSANSSPTGNQFNAYGEAGYDLKAKSLVVTPMVSLAYSSLWVNGFTESGAGALDLKVDPQHADSLQTGVGAKVGTVLQRNSVKVVPQIYATYQHEFSNNSRDINASLSQGSNTFAFQTDQSGKNFALVGARVNIFPKNNFSLQVDYNAEVGRDRYTAHTVSAGVRWEF